MSVLTRPIESVPGVGPRRAAAFRRIGLRCVADLVTHLPYRYERVLPEQAIARVETTVGPSVAAGANVTVSGEVASVRAVPGRGGRGRGRFEVTVEDPSGTILLTWFNAPWLRGKLHPGEHVRATGKVKRYGGMLQMVNPEWRHVAQEVEIAPATDADPDATLRPIYPGSEEITSTAVAAAVDRVLDEALEEIEDHFDDAYRRERSLPDLRSCYRAVHRGDDDEAIGQARPRLAFDELLQLQLAVMLVRRQRRDTQHAPPLPCDDAIDARILERLPFTLTGDQRTVVGEIAHDLGMSVPMNRLLQGDVGAGKTVVAVYAMLLAVAAGKQAALMAPTELLAEQHFDSIQRLLEDSDVGIRLVTGSLNAEARRTALGAIRRGSADLVIGTHALLTEHVAFHDLALVIIDEQHRFGVHQRATLRGRCRDEDAIPHMLVMTATPIPRTLSLTVFGDLDVSTIRELPPGRQPVVTRAMPPARADEVYAYVAERLAKGEQAYVVVPVIEESTAGYTDVATHLERLRHGPLRDFRLATIHGRLDRAERDTIMNGFRDGQIDALVATTVIEVGVDVPNATVMVVEDADRFGLAQLHQLRGRVGRGTQRGLCVLVADPSTDDGRARLEAIVGTTDGFAIAERDLEIRGPGELFGAKQAGLAPFLVARLPEDLELLRLARRDAVDWIERSPDLAAPNETLLRKRILKRHGAALGLGDVG